MSIIQIKLKRHMPHKRSYMFDAVTPALVCDALSFLITTPLYKKRDSLYFNKYNNNYDVEMPFILDKLDSDDATEGINLSEANSVLLIDENAETANNIRIFASVQRKFPAPWHIIDDIDELYLPRRFAGYKVDTPKSITYSDIVKSEFRRKDRRSCILYCS